MKAAQRRPAIVRGIEREPLDGTAADRIRIRSYEPTAAKRVLQLDARFRRTRDPLDALQVLHEAAQAQAPIPEACAAWLAAVQERRQAGEVRWPVLLGAEQKATRRGRRLTPRDVEGIRLIFETLGEQGRSSTPRKRGELTERERLLARLADAFHVDAKTIEDVIARRKTYAD